MKVQIINEYGYDEALFGLGLSFGLTSGYDGVKEFKCAHMNAKGESAYARLERVTRKLAHMDGGHNNILESCVVTMDIDAPRYWWSEFDRYRCGVTKQSESTIHTITKRPLTVDDFEAGVIDLGYLAKINSVIDTGDMYRVKQMLPEGFLQRRTICTNYKSLRNMYYQRKNHRLPEWHIFCDALRNGLEHFELIENYSDEEEA